MKRLAIIFTLGLVILLMSIWFSAYIAFNLQGTWIAPPAQWTCVIFGVIGMFLIAFGPAINSWIEVDE